MHIQVGGGGSGTCCCAALWPRLLLSVIQPLDPRPPAPLSSGPGPSGSQLGEWSPWSSNRANQSLGTVLASVLSITQETGHFSPVSYQLLDDGSKCHCYFYSCPDSSFFTETNRFMAMLTRSLQPDSRCLLCHPHFSSSCHLAICPP